MLVCSKLNCFFSMEFAPQYLTFNVSYTKFSVKLSIDGHSTQNNELCVGLFPWICQWDDFSMGVGFLISYI